MIIKWESPNIFVRALDEASKVNALGHLESHLIHGILSPRECIKKGIDQKLSMCGAIRMMTFDNEISVYELRKFRFWRVPMNYSLGLFISCPVSMSKNAEVDHPVILDSTPIEERKIVGAYVNLECISADDVLRVMKRTQIIQMYDKDLNPINYP